MASEAPPFWWDRPDWRSALLWPISSIYGLAAARRMRHGRRERTGMPVLCVGNPTVGGAGKTPIAIALAQQARRMGLEPGFLSRGHGGSLGKPHLVDLHHDSAKSTGDEPLLLAAEAPTAVTPNRSAGARLLIAEGCDFLIMDDGFQSARIHYDYGLLVVDAQRGLGNGHIIPGGPVRAPLIDQLRHADAVIRMGKGDAADPVVRLAARAALPIYHAVARPRPGSGSRGVPSSHSPALATRTNSSARSSRRGELSPRRGLSPTIITTPTRTLPTCSTRPTPSARIWSRRQRTP